jgi:hypothetical protein
VNDRNAKSASPVEQAPGFVKGCLDALELH